MKKLKIALSISALSTLAACGGGGDNGSNGLLLSTTTVVTLPAASIDTSTKASGLIALTGAAKCDVTMSSLNYQTPGVKAGEVSNSTAVLLLPSGPGCPAGPAPLLAYARGTEVLKSRTLASANPFDPETFTVLAIYAAQGYAVVATDYLGYADSQYPYHPYLHADSEATTVTDSIRAARKAAGIANFPLSGKVMLTGYSAGGHASMAAHRAIERDNAGEINIVAGGHMSGPYNLSQSIIQGAAQPIAGGQFFVPFFITAWQKVYGTLYSKPTDVFLAPYAADIENIFPGPYTYTTMLQAGKVPADVNYLPKLFQPAYLMDLVNNPNNPTVVAARKNDLLGWNPKSKIALCGGAQDPTVPFAVHAKVEQADFASRGIAVPLIDVDSTIRAQAAATGTPVNLGAYHGTLVPPLCMAALKASLFDPAR